MLRLPVWSVDQSDSLALPLRRHLLLPPQHRCCHFSMGCAKLAHQAQCLCSHVFWACLVQAYAAGLLCRASCHSCCHASSGQLPSALTWRRCHWAACSSDRSVASIASGVRVRMQCLVSETGGETLVLGGVPRAALAWPREGLPRGLAIRSCWSDPAGEAQLRFLLGCTLSTLFPALSRAELFERRPP